MQPNNMSNFVFKIMLLLGALTLIDIHMVEGIECYFSNGVKDLDTKNNKTTCEDLPDVPPNICYGFIGWENGKKKGHFGCDNDIPEISFLEKDALEKHLDALQPSGKVSGKLFLDFSGVMLDATANFEKTTFEKIWNGIDVEITAAEIDVKLGEARVNIKVNGHAKFHDFDHFGEKISSFMMNEEAMNQVQACFDNNCKSVEEWRKLLFVPATSAKTLQMFEASQNVKITFDKVTIEAIVEGNLKAEIDKIKLNKAIEIQEKVAVTIDDNSEFDLALHGVTSYSTLLMIIHQFSSVSYWLTLSLVTSLLEISVLGTNVHLLEDVLKICAILKFSSRS